MDAPPLPIDELNAVFGADAVAGVAPRVEQIYEPVASASAGIWRIGVGGRSAILKLVHDAEGPHPNWRTSADPAHWCYWRREVLAYESGLLESLSPGLRAPSCELIAGRAGGRVALWLEDLAGLPGPAWSLDRYGAAARHLGRMQGSYSDDRARPDTSWLSHGWLRSYLELRDGDLELVDDMSCWEHPLVAPWFPSPPIDRVNSIRDDQELFLDVLDALPQTLTHFDLHPANLFADGNECTAVIDWAFVGIGALAHDAAVLVADTVLDFHVAPADLDRLFTEIAGGYTAGLRDAQSDWPGDEADVRLAMSTSIAARYAWIAPAMLRAVAEDRVLLNRRPIAEAMQWWGPTVTFLLDRADEARAGIR